MTWLRCDDQEDGHPKIVRLDAETFRLYHRSRLYAVRHLTDGWVPREILWSLTRLQGEALEAAIAALLKAPPGHTAGLWEADGDDFRIHDFLVYNPSRADVLAERASTKRRVAVYRNEALTQVVRARDGAECRYCGQAVVWRDRRGPRGGTYDHVDPRGENSPENLVVACRGCNASKGGRTPDEAGMTLRPWPTWQVPADSEQKITSYISAPVPSRPVPGVESFTLHGGTGREGEGQPETTRAPDASPLSGPMPPVKADQSVQSPRATRRPRPVPKSRPSVAGPAQADVSRNGTAVHSGPESAARPGPTAGPAEGAELGKAVRRSIDTWYASFERAHGVKPMLTKGKDQAMLVRLIRSRGAAEVETLIKGFFETGTKWSRENNAWTVGAFYSQYNKLLIMQQEGSL